MPAFDSFTSRSMANPFSRQAFTFATQTNSCFRSSRRSAALRIRMLFAQSQPQSTAYGAGIYPQKEGDCIATQSHCSAPLYDLEPKKNLDAPAQGENLCRKFMCVCLGEWKVFCLRCSTEFVLLLRNLNFKQCQTLDPHLFLRRAGIIVKLV